MRVSFYEFLGLDEVGEMLRRLDGEKKGMECRWKVEATRVLYTK
jgi:hypothetical protein